MNPKYQEDILRLSKLLNLLLVIGLVGSLVVSVVLAIALSNVSSEKSRTLVPPSISRAFTVSDTTVDASYLHIMGEYFLNLKLNVTPANVTRQYGLLLDYVPADNWPSVQPTLVKDAENLRKHNATSRFDALPDKTHISLESMQFKQTGSLVKTVGDRTLPPEQTTYIVQMAYIDGEIALIGIKKEGVGQ